MHIAATCGTGAIFEQGTDEVQSAFKYAMLNHNLNVSSRRFELQAYVDVINTADAFKLSRLSEYFSQLSIAFIILYNFYRIDAMQLTFLNIASSINNANRISF